ncbi:MAG TPA: tRNA lysidine(34) synthetase TilS [Oceanipulchritudo sp.]|nr:tRNA lysidine(34) synthetase TilS [Oceanipulchritudo sp.]
MIRWADIVRRFGGSADPQRFPGDVKSHLCRIPPEQPLLAACSGGADSVYLVLALYAFLKDPEGQLEVLHFNHGQRGEEADADAAFVETLAQALGLGYHGGRLPIREALTEAGLRTARYRWMAGVYEERAAGGLCLGHHADDLMETQLMGLFSGRGPAGLASPAPVKAFADGHIRLRPLLGLRRASIQATLREIGAPWREDRSNRDHQRTRNWIREEILPRLLAEFPQNPHAGVERTRGLMAEMVEAVDSVLEGLALETDKPEVLVVKQLRGLPRAFIRRALMSWWLRHDADEHLPAAGVDTLLDLIRDPHGRGTVAIGKGQALYLGADDCLRRRKEAPAGPVAWGEALYWNSLSGPAFLPDGASLRATLENWEVGTEPYREADPRREAWIRMQTGPFQIRQWIPGDRYRPLGAPGSRKLQDLFTDAKMKREQKRTLPVITNREGDILWVPCFPPAEQVSLGPGSKSALKLTYERH